MSQGTLVATAALHFYVILWIPVSSGAGHCRSGVSMDGNALIGYTFASFLVNSPFECAVKCENEPRCQSYNYVIAGKVCELNNRTKEAKPAQLINDPDRFYMTKWADRGMYVLLIKHIIHTFLYLEQCVYAVRTSIFNRPKFSCVLYRLIVHYKANSAVQLCIACPTIQPLSNQLKWYYQQKNVINFSRPVILGCSPS